MTVQAGPAGPDDAILGVAPRATYWPERVDDCSEVLAGERGTIAFLGGGTELALGGRPTALDAVVRTGRMTRILDYAPADMVMVVEAGATLAQVQAAAAKEQQMLALDPPHPDRATVGGLIATGGFGPRRARYGAIRDLILGVALVRADGVIGRSGGKVVKNVAGFDLPKLLCGSLGTLGLIAEATFRLHPLPETGATAWFGGLSPEQVVDLIRRAREAQLEPTSAIALRGEAGYDVGIRFEGFERGVRDQIGRMKDIGLAAGISGEPLADDQPFRRRHDAVREGGPLRVKLAALPGHLSAVDAVIAPLLAALRGGTFTWYATLGLGFAAGEIGDEEPVRAALVAARTELVAAGGSLVIEEAPAALRSIDPWGPPPPSFGLMAKLKNRFDPEGRLNPGRFVGGL
jgi:glycolate oxidase FAD binding subunit